MPATHSTGLEKNIDEKRETGVGLAIKIKLVKQPGDPHRGISDLLMCVCLPLPKKRNGTIISVFTPTMTNLENFLEKFYEDLRSAIEATPKSDKLICIAEFNARVGTADIDTRFFSYSSNWQVTKTFYSPKLNFQLVKN